MPNQRHADWVAAVESGDVDTYAQFVTEDVVWIPPGGRAVVGRAAFRSWLEPFLGRFSYASRIDDVAAYETGDWIAETGTFRSMLTPRSGGSPASHSSRYFALWRRVDGVWRLNRYVDMGSLT